MKSKRRNMTPEEEKAFRAGAAAVGDDAGAMGKLLGGYLGVALFRYCKDAGSRDPDSQGESE